MREEEVSQTRRFVYLRLYDLQTGGRRRSRWHILVYELLQSFATIFDKIILKYTIVRSHEGWQLLLKCFARQRGHNDLKISYALTLNKKIV